MKYLELVNDITSIEIAKSFYHHYVAARKSDKACIYSPIANNIEIITHNINKERIIYGPCVLEFYVPSYYMAGGDEYGLTFDFYPDSGVTQQVDSPKVTCPEIILTETTSYFQVFSALEKWYVFSGFQFKFYNEIPRLYKMCIEFFEPGVLKFNITDGLYKEFQKKYLTLNSHLDISNSDNILLLTNELSKKKSCFFMWDGESSAELKIGSYWNEELTPDLPNSSTYIQSTHTLQPGEYVQLYDFVKDWGTFFKKAMVVSDKPGVLKTFQYIPPRNNAILLSSDPELDMNISDPNQLFCIHKDCGNLCINTTSNVANIYFSNEPEFDINDSTSYIKYIPLENPTDSEINTIQLSNTDLSDLSGSLTDDYIYVKFDTDQEFTVKTSKPVWDSSITKTHLVYPGLEMKGISSSTRSTYFRIPYNYIENKQINIICTSAYTGTSLTTVISKTYNGSTGSSHPYYRKISVPKKPDTNVITYDAQEINNLKTEGYIDKYGFVYLRLVGSSRPVIINVEVVDPE